MLIMDMLVKCSQMRCLFSIKISSVGEGWVKTVVWFKEKKKKVHSDFTHNVYI